MALQKHFLIGTWEMADSGPEPVTWRFVRKKEWTDPPGAPIYEGVLYRRQGGRRLGSRAYNYLPGRDELIVDRLGSVPDLDPRAQYEDRYRVERLDENSVCLYCLDGEGTGKKDYL